MATLSCFLAVMLIAAVHSQSTGLPFNCGFESNICGMIQDTTDSPGPGSGNTFDWTRKSGATGTGDTGPDNGQGGSSYYMYIEVSDPQKADTFARLSTPSINDQGEVCLQYYYNQYGSHIGYHAVFIQQPGSSVFQEVANSRLSGAQNKPGTSTKMTGADWNQVRRTVNLPGFNYRIGWIGAKGSDYKGDIAVDSITITRGNCNGPRPTEPPELIRLPLICNFENSLCGISQSQSDNFDWQLKQGGTPTFGTGPSNAQSGAWYVYAEADGRRESDLAILQTRPLDITNNGQACLQFYSHMWGDNAAQLSVYYRRNRQNIILQSYNGNRENRWIQRSINLELQDNDMILIQARMGGSIRSDIAIDNWRLTSGTCSIEPVVTTQAPETTSIEPPVTTPPPPVDNFRNLPYSCGFESSDLCGFTRFGSNRIDWTRLCSQRTATEDTGPPQASQGACFVYIEANNLGNGEGSTIQTPRLRPSNPGSDQCVTFYYHMYGSNVGRLVMYTNRRSVNDGNFRASGNKGDIWQRASVTVQLFTDDRIYFYAERNNGIFSDISIDQFNVQNGRCSGGTPTPAPTQPPNVIRDYFSCDGESDGRNNNRCVLRQDTGDNMDWVRGSGKTTSGTRFNRQINGQKYPVTGPTRAQQGEYYLFIEASNEDPDEMGRLFLRGSDFTSGSSEMCLRFWYSMNGHHIGRMSLYVMQNGEKVERWSVVGDQGPDWKRAAVEMNQRSVSEVGVEGRKMTKGFSGDMAIDGISMTNGRCQSIPSQFLFLCNFELSDGSSSLCGMEQESRRDQFDWRLNRGQTESKPTGPQRAYNGEWYIYIEATKKQRNQFARILLPQLNRNGDICVRFRYNMFGHHINTLEVFTGSNGVYTERWSRVGEQGPNWIQGSAYIENMNFNDRIGFRGIVGNAYSGDIAIDNIQVTQGRC